MSDGAPGDRFQVAVEFYWRSSCTSSKPRRLLGRAMLRRRLLEARGWTVVGIMSHEWQPPPSIADNDAAVSAFRRGVLQKKLWFALQTIVT